MILYYKTKILMSGLFSMVNFKIDGFIEKTELNITEITRLNIDNNIKYISIVSNDEIEL